MPRSKAKTAIVSDITQLLHEDHQKVRELFFQFDKAEDEAEKEELVKQIITELYVHAKVEEDIVYPNVEEEAENAQDLVDEAENEHRMVKYLMAELSQMTADEDQFDAKVTVLCELVTHHIREEEKEMFKKLRESGADLEELAQQVQEAKEELMAEPIPPMQASLSIGEEEIEYAGEDEEEEEVHTSAKSSAKGQSKSNGRGRSNGRRKSA
ncbi:MAG: hemerythrin domain-containing protein [Candidatus Melainabacteria bacterium]|nr:MAG: hemerythrin domain-containing protein [Candidatus Melainabacteria bacterium]